MEDPSQLDQGNYDNFNDDEMEQFFPEEQEVPKRKINWWLLVVMMVVVAALSLPMADEFLMKVPYISTNKLYIAVTKVAIFAIAFVLASKFLC